MRLLLYPFIFLPTDCNVGAVHGIVIKIPSRGAVSTIFRKMVMPRLSLPMELWCCCDGAVWRASSPSAPSQQHHSAHEGAEACPGLFSLKSFLRVLSCPSWIKNTWFSSCLFVSFVDNICSAFHVRPLRGLSTLFALSPGRSVP